MEDRVVLDREDLRRTLVRIAHEIIEKNPVATHSPWSASTRAGAALGRRLHALVGELSGAEVPLGDLDISFYRDDVSPAIRAPSRSSTPRTSTSSSTGARSSSSTT